MDGPPSMTRLLARSWICAKPEVADLQVYVPVTGNLRTSRGPGRSLTRLASDLGLGSEAGRAVDDLAEQVGVPVVARVLLHEVLPHPAHRDGLLAEGEGLVQLRALQRGIDGPALGPVAREVLLGAGRAGLFEVRVRGIGSVVQVGHLLSPVGLPDPSA